MLGRILTYLYKNRSQSPYFAGIKSYLRDRGLTINLCEGEEKLAVLRQIGEIRNEVEMLLTDTEAYEIHALAKSALKIPGDYAEVGAYQGGSAKIISLAKKDRAFRIFDSFNGLPSVDEIDKANFCEGQYQASARTTQNYLSQWPNLHFYIGIFPESAEPAKDLKFAFVHFDVDTYKSTQSCLEFFYPRLNQGAILVSHDYSTIAGVKKAFDEFFADRAETIIELSGSQCLIVKR